MNNNYLLRFIHRSTINWGCLLVQLYTETKKAFGYLCCRKNVVINWIFFFAAPGCIRNITKEQIRNIFQPGLIY